MMDFRTALTLARAGHVIIATGPGQYEDRGIPIRTAPKVLKARDITACPHGPDADHPVHICPTPVRVRSYTEPGWTVPPPAPRVKTKKNAEYGTPEPAAIEGGLFE